MHDPRYLSEILKDLIQHVRQWSASSCQVLKEAEYVQRNAREQAERSFHNASIKADQALNDQTEVLRKKNEAEGLMDMATNAVASSGVLREKVESALETADSTLTHWRNELEEALAWLESARAQLERALYALQQTVHEFNSAKENLQRAIDRFDSCRNSNRNNCTPEARDVQYAEYRLNEAHENVLIAQAEVQGAEEEVARAEAWVARCEKAVDYANQAVSLANDALEHAIHAQNSAERCREDSESLRRFVDNAQAKADQERELTERMMNQAVQGQQLKNDAEYNLKRAVSANDSAYRLATGGRQELEFRIHQLFELDLPTLKGI